MQEWQALTAGLGRALGPTPERLDGLAYDSRRVDQGYGFIAVPGQKDDGHHHVREAVARGARALFVQDESVVPPDMAALVVPDTRRAMAILAARFYDYPARNLGILGVTGTNGKTTTAFLAQLALGTVGPTGLLGTVWTIVGGRARDSVRTTPEALDFSRALAAMRLAGDRFAAVEVSSEGLAQHRCDGIDFNIALYTNLTQDHLNFHGTMEHYFEAKCRLFDMLTEQPEGGRGSGPRRAIIACDDEYGLRLARRCKERGIEVTTLSAIGNPADVMAEEVRAGPESVEFTALGERVRLPIGGRFNVSNGLAAFVAAVALGAEPTAAARALATAKAVPGRFERVRAGQPFAVLVDYAHSPGGLDNVLRAAREVTVGRLLVVFGAGGDRDRGKRPRMGQVAASLADVVVLTSDNPRSEDPQAILDDVEAGARGVADPAGATLHREADRRLAIRLVLSLAREGDTVVIAGKGHETYQMFRDETIDFDDRAVAREELLALGWGEA